MALPDKVGTGRTDFLPEIWLTITGLPLPCFSKVLILKGL
jgi:hypothetical protein